MVSLLPGMASDRVVDKEAAASLYSDMGRELSFSKSSSITKFSNASLAMAGELAMLLMCSL